MSSKSIKIRSPCKSITSPHHSPSKKKTKMRDPRTSRVYIDRYGRKAIIEYNIYSNQVYRWYKNIGYLVSYYHYLHTHG